MLQKSIYMQYLGDAFVQSNTPVKIREHGQQMSPGQLGLRALLKGSAVTSLCMPQELNQQPANSETDTYPQSHCFKQNAS